MNLVEIARNYVIDADGEVVLRITLMNPEQPEAPYVYRFVK